MRLIVLFLLTGLNFGFSQGIEFFSGSWSDALLKAKTEEKLIFVDAYAKWCGPCKRMASTVFTNVAVGEYYNSNFVNLKLDMEETESQDFKKFFSVSAYPTLFFIDAEGELVKKVVGGRQIQDFIDLGKDIIKSYDRSGIYANAYEEGDRSFDLVIKYIKALNRADKPSQKISNEYIRENDKLSDGQLALLLYESLVSADSRIFDLFISNRDKIEALFSKEKVNQKLEAACWATVYNAIDFEVSDLLIEAQQKCNSNISSLSKSFALESAYEYYKGVDDEKMMCESAIALAKKLHKKNPVVLNNIAEELFEQALGRTDMLSTAEKLAKMSIDNEKENPDYLLTYSKILFSNNQNTDALKYAKKALEFYVQSGQPTQGAQDLINDIQAM
jgi:thiol-disulfide isomerase/thioredoxin